KRCGGCSPRTTRCPAARSRRSPRIAAPRSTGGLRRSRSEEQGFGSPPEASGGYPPGLARSQWQDGRVDSAALRDRLATSRLYLCTDARDRQADLPAFLDAVLGAGVDVVQLRHKGLEAGQELRLLETFRAACDRHGALLAVNDRADVAFACGADVLHLGQDDLPVPVARRVLGPGPVIGLSSHSPAQSAAAAVADGVGYFCAGPGWGAPTAAGT